MKNVMTRAWEIAKEAVVKFGGKVKEYFALSLRQAWSEMKKGANKMEKVYEVINKEIEKFNLSYDEDNATDNQKEYTKKFEGLDHINTTKTNAKNSWDFSKTIESILAVVEEGVKSFEKVPEDAILKGTPEYKELRKSEKPNKIIVGLSKDLTFNQLSKVLRGDFSVVCEKVFYFDGK